MNKIYLFGIGGTGSRVLRSLSMLLASGIETKNFEIVPIIIDPDQSNGDVTRTVDILRNYKFINENLSFTSNDKNVFFKTPINELISGSNFKFELGDLKNDKFSDYIDYLGLDKKNQSLVSFLFSEENLNSDMVVGFKGNPNIGSVVLNRFKESKEFSEIANNFKKGDRIFIVSSIFGGTGAAGFPLLLKNLRNVDHSVPNWALIKDACIGAITVLPYFNVNVDEESAIDGATFVSKAKAALKYYDKNISGNNSINALYYIADDYSNNFENNEGGVSQKNDAHIVELLSALSIVDFSQLSDQDCITTDGKALNPIFKEFGVLSDDLSLSLKHLSLKSGQVLNKPLTQFMLFNFYHRQKTNLAFDQVWAKNLKITSLSTSSFYQNLSKFHDEFYRWMTELQNNKRSFSPFDLNPNDNNLFEFVRGIQPISKFFDIGKKNYNKYDFELAKSDKDLSNNLSDSQKYIELFYTATDRIVNEKFNF